MVKTASTMLELGRRAPDFSLPNVDGTTVSLLDFQDAPALVVVFMCNHCPFVQHLAAELANFGGDCQAKGVAVVAISSNDVSTHPEDSPEQMIHEVEGRGYTFAYLYDETQEVAKAYRAACTPDFYVFDKDQAASVPRTIRRQPTRFRHSRHRRRLAKRASTPYWQANRFPSRKNPASAATLSGKKAPNLAISIPPEWPSRHFSPMGPEKAALFGIKRFE